MPIRERVPSHAAGSIGWWRKLGRDNIFLWEEHDEGTYIMNAKDLCMIEHIPELLAAGVDSLKLEGRAKSSYYVAVVTNAYRSAVDAYLQQPEGFVLPEWIREEVYKVSHRGYCTGFFFGKPEGWTAVYRQQL